MNIFLSQLRLNVVVAVVVLVVAVVVVVVTVVVVVVGGVVFAVRCRCCRSHYLCSCS